MAADPLAQLRAALGEAAIARLSGIADPRTARRVAKGQEPLRAETAERIRRGLTEAARGFGAASPQDAAQIAATIQRAIPQGSSLTTAMAMALWADGGWINQKDLIERFYDESNHSTPHRIMKSLEATGLIEREHSPAGMSNRALKVRWIK